MSWIDNILSLVAKAQEAPAATTALQSWKPSAPAAPTASSSSSSYKPPAPGSSPIYDAMIAGPGSAAQKTDEPSQFQKTLAEWELRNDTTGVLYRKGLDNIALDQPNDPQKAAEVYALMEGGVPAERERLQQEYLSKYGLDEESQKEAAKVEEKRVARQEFFTSGALGSTDDERGKAKPMTWEAYNALTDNQRAAVDYNTMLVQAVRKDRKMRDEYDPTAEERQVYDKTVANLFGDENRGSEFYAPETLAVLKQLDFKHENADLDDFLQLRAAITEEDIARIDAKPPLALADPSPVAAPDYTTPALERQEFVTQVVDSSKALQDSLLKGNEMLQSYRATARADRTTYLNQVGVQNEVWADVGYGEAMFENDTPLNDDAYFQKAFDTLASQQYGGKQAEILQQIALDLKGPGQMESFLSYVDTRSRNAMTYGTELGLNDKVQYMAPDEFRKALGMDK